MSVQASSVLAASLSMAIIGIISQCWLPPLCRRARTRYGWPAEEQIVAALTKYKEDKALD